MPRRLRIRRVAEIVEKDGSLYVRTKGDFEPTPDEGFTPVKNICGIAVQIIKRDTELWKQLMGK